MVNKLRSGSPDDRRARIVDLVRHHGRIGVDQLARTLGASAETVRRDLALLARQHRLRKVHGGAEPPDAPEGPFAERLRIAVVEKRAIAAAAAALFDPDDSIFVDTGSTTLIFAQALARRRDLTVITNGLEIARTIAEGGGKVFLLGGAYDAERDEALGLLTVEQVARFHAGHAVLTVGTLAAQGPMDFDVDEAQVARAMVAQADRVTVLADSSKLGRTALFQICPLDRVDRLVVDRAPDPELAPALVSAGVEVIIAPIVSTTE